MKWNEVCVIASMAGLIFFKSGKSYIKNYTFAFCHLCIFACSRNLVCLQHLYVRSPFYFIFFFNARVCSYICFLYLFVVGIYVPSCVPTVCVFLFVFLQCGFHMLPGGHSYTMSLCKASFILWWLLYKSRYTEGFLRAAHCSLCRWSVTEPCNHWCSLIHLAKQSVYWWLFKGDVDLSLMAHSYENALVQFTLAPKPV